MRNFLKNVIDKVADGAEVAADVVSKAAHSGIEAVSDVAETITNKVSPEEPKINVVAARDIPGIVRACGLLHSQWGDQSNAMKMLSLAFLSDVYILTKEDLARAKHICRKEDYEKCLRLFD